MSESQRVPQKPVDKTRRTFLGGVAATAGLFVFGEEQSPVLAQAEDRSMPSPVFSPKPEVPPTFHQGHLPFAASYTKEERDRMTILVSAQSNYVTGEKFVHVAEAKQTEVLRGIGERYEALIKKTLAENNISLDTGLQASLLGLILTESNGNPQEDNGQARGLCQVTASALTEVAKQYPRVWDKNMYDPADNIFVAGKYLEILTNRYEKPELALWAYHLGGGRLWKSVKEHLVLQGISRDALEGEIDNLPAENQNAPIIRKYAEKLSLPRLIDSPAVHEVLKRAYQGSEFDGALQYVPRVIAGATLIRNAIKPS